MLFYCIKCKHKRTKLSFNIQDNIRRKVGGKSNSQSSERKINIQPIKMFLANVINISTFAVISYVNVIMLG